MTKQKHFCGVNIDSPEPEIQRYFEKPFWFRIKKKVCFTEMSHKYSLQRKIFLGCDYIYYGYNLQ
jgi:hypothetical protein